MASTPESDAGFLGSNAIGSFGYGIGISLGILLLITTITLASYFCTRTTTTSSSSPSSSTIRRNSTPDETVHVHMHVQEFVVDVGLDEETIKSYPKISYADVKNRNKDMCCSICLADYKSSDVLRLLPDCRHLFHPKCVDPWLRMHPTCPVCRMSPLPTPMSTPLAEIVPLASRRD